MEIEQMSWEQFEIACEGLVNLIHKHTNVHSLQNIYGIPRGGLVVAVKLSHLLQLPLIIDVKQISPTTLVVDDIADTGETLEKLLSTHQPALVVTLYKHNQTMVEPDVWMFQKTDKWIQFPWEV